MSTNAPLAINVSIFTPGVHKVTLTGSDATPGATINVYRATVAGQEGLPALATGVPLAGGAFTYIDTSGLVEGTTYYYKTTAVVGTLESAFSPEASALIPTLPTPPSNLVAVAI